MAGQGVGLQRLGDLPAVDVGHHHVEQDEIRRRRADLVERVLAVHGGHDVVALHLEVDLEQSPDHMIVVDRHHPRQV